MDGILNVLKPPGMTSSDVVVFLRKNLGIKKIGHTGTLDPEAAGVLPVCLGKATRISDYIMHRDKIYRCGMKLGITTDTADLTGHVISESDNIPDMGKIEKAFEAFHGQQDQIPPMHSAIKVEGKKLYELARQGIQLELEPRKIQIHKIKLIAHYPNNVILFETVCSKGTYIRALCRDIGNYLGCGAAMAFLIRTASGNFNLKDSMTLDEILQAHEQGELDSLVIPMDRALENVMPCIVLKEECRDRVSHGNQIEEDYILEKAESAVTGRLCRIYCGSKFMGVGYYTAGNGRKAIKMKSVLV
ncbi:MAG TPA: tRNA pseudouridine(55) synthase TruB [Clostridiales bacterium]|nr:tRNA pseudouridine(55) synthase TruB [Clostridiales bacterium]